MYRGCIHPKSAWSPHDKITKCKVTIGYNGIKFIFELRTLEFIYVDPRSAMRQLLPLWDCRDSDAALHRAAFSHNDKSPATMYIGCEFNAT
jgi:hypothetical protein